MKLKEVLIIIGVFLIFTVFINGCGQEKNPEIKNESSPTSSPVICPDPPCLGRYFQSCTPAELTMASGNQSLKITIHGFENDRCHFTMVFGNVTGANCFFKRENLNDKVLNQMFGNKEGQDAIIAEACGQ